MLLTFIVILILHVSSTNEKLKNSKTICYCCNIDKETVDNLKEHLKRDHSEFNCFDCGKVWPTYKRLLQHIYDSPRRKLCVQKSTENTKICYVCNMDKDSEHSLKQHIKSAHPAEVKCFECGKIWPSYNRLLKHQYDSHLRSKRQQKRKVKQENNNSKIPIKKNTRNTVCYVCKVDKKKFKFLFRHVQKKHPGPIKCFDCGKIWPNYRRLIKHRHDSHLRQEKNQRQSLGFKTEQDEDNFGMKKESDENSDFLNMKNETTKNIFNIRRNSICYVCNADLVTGNNLRLHLKNEHKGEVNCFECGKKWPNYKRLLKHRYDSHLRAEKKLCRSKQRDQFSKNYQDIKLPKYLPKTSKCFACNIDMITPLKLHNHIKSEHPNEVTCLECGKKWPSYKRLSKHRLDSHLRASKKNSVKDSIKTKIKRNTCLVCDKEQTSFVQLTTHLSVEHPGIIICNICNEKCPNYNEFLDHKQNKHSEVRSIFKDARKTRRCFACDINLDSEEELLEHIKEKHPEEIQCLDCSKFYLSYSRLKAHRFRCMRKLKCMYCERVFRARYILNMHLVKVHKKNDLLATKSVTTNLCNICGKVVFGNSNFIVHIRRHSGERPFKCDICEKYYDSVRSLRSHKEAHNIIKKYKCQICVQSFPKRFQLYKHKIKMHSASNKVYRCKLCLAKYSCQSYLKTHFDSVHLNIRHKCDLCGKDFAYKRGLRRHLKSHNIQQL